MNNERRRWQLGLFVIASAILLGVLAVFFGGSPRMFQVRAYYTIVFDDAPGVVKGTPVRKSGVRIGEVDTVELDDDRGVVRVRIAIDPRYSLRDNEEPRIVPDLLSRDTTIDFFPKPEPKPAKPPAGTNKITPVQFVAQAQQPPPNPPSKVLPPGSEIRGVTPPDYRQLIRDASDVLPSAQLSLSQIRRSVERFERIAPVLEDALREYTELARAAREIVPEVRRTNDDLRAVLAKASGIETSLTRTLDETQDAARQVKRLGERLDVVLQTNQTDIDRIVRNTAESLQRIVSILSDENQRNFTGTLKSAQTAARSIEEMSTQARTRTLPQFQDSMVKFDSVLMNLAQLTKPYADRSDRMSRNLDASIEHLARVLGGFGDAARGDGSLQKLLGDPSLFNNLNDASLMLARILPRVDRVLQDIEVFADKIARHPESLGVGGAVRPSGGLKDPPGASQSLRPKN